jgi:flagellar assembly protein FliH
MSTPPRRPRFLSDVPEAQAPAPARFLALAMGKAAVRPMRGAAQAAAPDEAQLRRAAQEKVAAAVQALRAQADRLAEEAHTDALEIAFLVARKILDIELTQNPEALFALVRSALGRLGSSRRVVVHLHADDAAALQAGIANGDAEGISAARIEILPDPALQPGDVLVDTDFGQVDGRLSTRLDEIRRAVDAASEEGA